MSHKQSYNSKQQTQDYPPSGDLSQTRIITKNLVYVIGLSQNIACRDTLMKYEYFGQYGSIRKIVINKKKAYNLNNPYGPSYSAYVTYSHPCEASIAILALDDTIVDNHLIRASFGTTKYCSFYLKRMECTNKDCLFLHKKANESDIIKREDLNVNKNIFYEQQLFAIKIADIYNPEIKKKLLLGGKNKNTMFPSTDLIYKSDIVIENEPKLIVKKNGSNLTTSSINVNNSNSNNINNNINNSNSSNSAVPVKTIGIETHKSKKKCTDDNNNTNINNTTTKSKEQIQKHIPGLSNSVSSTKSTSNSKHSTNTSSSSSSIFSNNNNNKKKNTTRNLLLLEISSNKGSQDDITCSSTTGDEKQSIISTQEELLTSSSSLYSSSRRFSRFDFVNKQSSITSLDEPIPEFVLDFIDNKYKIRSLSKYLHNVDMMLLNSELNQNKIDCNSHWTQFLFTNSQYSLVDTNNTNTNYSNKERSKLTNNKEEFTEDIDKINDFIYSKLNQSHKTNYNSNNTINKY